MKLYNKQVAASKLVENPQYIDEDDGSGLTDRSIFDFDGGQATLDEFYSKGYYYVARVEFESGESFRKTFKDKGLYDDSARESAVAWIESCVDRMND